MKKSILCILCACLSASVFAQAKSFLSFWGQGGESSMLTTLLDNDNCTSLGAGGGIGIGYELRDAHFLFATGLGANATYSIFTLPNATCMQPNLVDDEGDSFTLIADQSQRTDRYTNISLQIPIMVGAQAEHFYFLAGLKFDFSTYTYYDARARVRTYGLYDAFNDPFTDMPEHGFFPEMSVQTVGTTNLELNVIGTAEIGVRLGHVESYRGFGVPKKKHFYRLAIFADYGLGNLNKKGKNDLITLPTHQSMIPTLNDFLSTKEAINPVHSLMIGVKFAVLYTLPERKKICKICED